MFKKKDNFKGTDFKERLSLYKGNIIKVNLINSEGILSGRLYDIGLDYLDLVIDNEIMTIPLKNIELIYYHKNKLGE